MKRHFLLLLGLALSMAACNTETESLIGTWKADKVNVQFDEQKTTPALVQQIGEMEKQNTFSITADSILTFKGMDSEWQKPVSLKEGTTLLCGEMVFGKWSEGQIVTRTDSPLGEVIVTYRKE